MKKKIVGIFVCMLLIITIFPITGAMNVSETEKMEKDIISIDEGSIALSRTDWWPMFHHDLEHSGYSTSTGPVTNDLLWSKELGWWILSSPAVIDDRVYVSDATCNLYCLNALSGNIIWSYYTGDAGDGHGRTPAVADGRVYFGVGAGLTGTAKLYCLDAAAGSLIWIYPTNNLNILSAPSIYDGKVYFGTTGQVEHNLDYYVYCLDIDGNLIWSYQLDDWVQSSPSVVNGKVYVGSHDNNVYCLDAADGSYIWSYTTGGYVRSSPAVVDGKVYIGSDDNNVYCLDAADGSYIWSYTTGNQVYSSPAVYDGIIYVGSFDNNVYSLDAADGSYIWSYTTSDLMGTSPVVADGKIYVASYDGVVYCLNAADGSYIWSYTTGDQIWYSPSISNGKVYIGSKDHYVYCFGGDNPVPNLDCDGDLSWIDVSPGDTVSGSFTVENIGDPLSFLGWEVESYPEWGTWSFNPESGTGLEEGDTITIDVEVIAPDEPETEFTGEVILVNSEDPTDTCTIDVSLATPVSQFQGYQQILRFLQSIIERYPILRQVLGL